MANTWRKAWADYGKACMAMGMGTHKRTGGSKRDPHALTNRIVTYIRQHWDTDNMDTEDIADAARQSVEWLTNRGYSSRSWCITDANIADALNHVTLY